MTTHLAIAGATLQIMGDYRVTFYDAVYHAVAITTGATLITADAAYYRKVGQLGAIRMLEDFV